MTDPTLSDCINYMKQQLKGMEKYPKSYEFNIPYYRKTIELLETRGTTDGNCATCVKAVVIDERPHGEWKVDKKIYCSECGESICDFIPNPTDAVGLILSNNFCPNCGADMRKEGDENDTGRSN